MEPSSSVVKITGNNPGRTLAVFCGVHGNESVGIQAVEEVLRDVSVENGTVYFVYANPKAIELGVRYIERNLNRCFVRGNLGETYEDMRARELMKLLDSTDALLDVHASNTPASTPFVIYGEPAADFVRTLNFDIVSTGWDDVEPGATDGYMLRQNKPGICIECGYINDVDQHGNLAKDSIRAFLAFYGATADKKPVDVSFKQRLLHVYEAPIKEDESFEYLKQYSDFEFIPTGTCFARDKHREYCVKEDSVVIFATNKQVGDEVCVLGRWAEV